MRNVVPDGVENPLNEGRNDHIVRSPIILVKGCISPNITVMTSFPRKVVLY